MAMARAERRPAGLDRLARSRVAYSGISRPGRLMTRRDGAAPVSCTRRTHTRYVADRGGTTRVVVLVATWLLRLCWIIGLLIQVRLTTRLPSRDKDSAAVCMP
jgi:hypothetical protein